MEFQDPKLYEPDQGRQRIGDHVDGRRFCAGNFHPTDHLRNAIRRMFLVEACLLVPIRTTHQAQGSTVQMRQDPLTHRLVVARQGLFGERLLRIQHALRMTDGHPRDRHARRSLASRALTPGRGCRRLLVRRSPRRGFSSDRGGRLVLAKAVKRRLAKLPALRPFREADVRHQSRLDPMDRGAICGSRNIQKRRGPPFECA